MSRVVKMVSSENLLKSVIISQNGSLLSGIRELIQNGCDSYYGTGDIGPIFINLSDGNTTTNFKTLTYKDNGKTFGKTEEEVINNFFVFGQSTKSAEELGKFGIGRGQILAMIYDSDTQELHGKHYIHSGNYLISDIDISNLTANIEYTDDFYAGTIWTIESDKYLFDLDQIYIYLKDNICIPNKIIFQDIEIERVIEGKMFDTELYTLYLKEDESYYGQITIYDRGIKVTKTSIVSGFGGTLITKVPLELNFARNEIIVNQTYTYIVGSVKDTIAEYIADNFDTVKTNDKKFGLLNLYLSNPSKFHKLETKNIVKLANDTYSSITGLKFKGILYTADNDSRIADSAITIGLFVVGEYSPLANWNVRDFLNYNNIKIVELSSSEYGIMHANKGFSILATHTYQWFLDIVNSIHLPDDIIKREYRIGNTSEQFIAWTDGKEIVFNESYVQEVSNTMEKMLMIIPLLAHEYCHIDSDLTTNYHDYDFYKRWSDLQTKIIDGVINNETRNSVNFNHY